MSADDTKVYVGNLPFSVTSQDLNDMFQECGKLKINKKVKLLKHKLLERANQRDLGLYNSQSTKKHSRLLMNLMGLIWTEERLKCVGTKAQLLDNEKLFLRKKKVVQ
jgi:RNA recognition motif-containing protein